MAQGRSYYGPGTSHTDVSFDPRTDPTAALQALLKRETSAPRAVAPAGPKKPSRGTFQSGGGPRLSHTAGDAAMALTRGGERGSHSFVKNMWGPNQAGGFVSSGYEPGAVYGGWDPTGGQAGASIDTRVPQHVPQFEPQAQLDPAVQSQLNAATLGPSLAQQQWRERQERQARGGK